MALGRFLTLAVQCLLPIFETSPREYLGLSIVNSDAQRRRRYTSWERSE